MISKKALARFCLAVGVFVEMAAVATYVSAQGEPPARGHVILPPVFGATALSTQIHAQAAYVQAVGDFLESAAIARRHHAIAAEHEMRNALKWVETYFERRALNRAYRAKENPPYLDQEEHRHAQKRRRIVDDPYIPLEGDLTDELNWLLDELSSMWLAYKYLPGDQKLAGSEFDQRLLPEDIDHVRLTDGGRVGGKTLVFRAHDAKLFDTPWPRALRGPEFETVRRQFETVRDAVVRRIRDEGEFTWESQAQLMSAVDDLSAEFNRYYTHERRTSSPAEHLVYQAGKRFLQNLAGSVYRATETNDLRAFDGSYRFSGDSVVDLVDHMYDFGLHFARPEPGDEGVYQKVFLGLRHLYTALDSKDARPDGGS